MVQVHPKFFEYPIDVEQAEADELAALNLLHDPQDASKAPADDKAGAAAKPGAGDPALKTGAADPAKAPGKDQP
jgi:hypothetical protein